MRGVPHEAGGRNRRVAEAYVRAFHAGQPQSFEELEVSATSRPHHTKARVHATVHDQGICPVRQLTSRRAMS